MILSYPNQKNVVKAESQNISISCAAVALPAKVLKSLIKQFSNDVLVCCAHHLKSFLDKEKLPALLHHQKMMLSYCPVNNFFGNKISFFEASTFLKINRTVKYPVWQISSCMGAINANVELKMALIAAYSDFNFYLSSLAKIVMPVGLFYYSEPKSLTNNDFESSKSASNYKLFNYDSAEQLKGYKLVLFLKLLNSMSVFGYFKFWNSFQKKWVCIALWASKLSKYD